MKILNITPATSNGDGLFRCVAVYDAEIGAIRINDLRLLRAPDGKLRTYSQNRGRRRCVTFAPELAEQLSVAASAALEGRAANK